METNELPNELKNQISEKSISKEDVTSVVNTSKHTPKSSSALKVSITPKLSNLLYLTGGLIALYLYVTGYFYYLFWFFTPPYSIYIFLLFLSFYAGVKLFKAINQISGKMISKEDVTSVVNTAKNTPTGSNTHKLSIILYIIAGLIALFLYMTGWWWLFFEPPLSIIFTVLFLSFYAGVKLFKVVNKISRKMISKGD